MITAALAILALVAGIDGVWSAAGILGGVAAGLVMRALHECARATAQFMLVLGDSPTERAQVSTALDRAQAGQA